MFPLHRDTNTALRAILHRLPNFGVALAATSHCFLSNPSLFARIGHYERLRCGFQVTVSWHVLNGGDAIFNVLPEGLEATSTVLLQTGWGKRDER
jgi:hypothetical protein